MTDNHHEREYRERLQALLQQQADEVPVEVGERLAQIRRRAVAEMARPAVSRWLPGWPDRGWMWGSAGFVAATAVVVLAISLLVTNSADLIEIPLSGEPDVALVQDMELLEDLEFLAWLEEEEHGAG